MSFWLKRVESFLEQVDHTAASQISSLKQEELSAANQSSTSHRDQHTTTSSSNGPASSNKSKPTTSSSSSSAPPPKPRDDDIFKFLNDTDAAPPPSSSVQRLAMPAPKPKKEPKVKKTVASPVLTPAQISIPAPALVTTSHAPAAAPAAAPASQPTKPKTPPSPPPAPITPSRQLSPARSPPSSMREPAHAQETALEPAHALEPELNAAHDTKLEPTEHHPEPMEQHSVPTEHHSELTEQHPEPTFSVEPTHPVEPAEPESGEKGGWEDGGIVKEEEDGETSPTRSISPPVEEDHVEVDGQRTDDLIDVSEKEGLLGSNEQVQNEAPAVSEEENTKQEVSEETREEVEEPTAEDKETKEVKVEVAEEDEEEEEEEEEEEANQVLNAEFIQKYNDLITQNEKSARENKLLRMRQEVVKLHEEINSLTNKNRSVSQAIQQTTEILSEHQKMAHDKDKQIIKMRQQEQELETALHAKDMQIAGLRAQFEQVEKTLRLREATLTSYQERIEKLTQDKENLLDGNQRNSVQIQSRVDELDRLMSEEKRLHQQTQQQAEEREAELQAGMAEYTKALAIAQRGLDEKTLELQRSTIQLKEAQNESKSIRQELVEYKLRATKVLQSKEKTIQELTERLSAGPEGGGNVTANLGELLRTQQDLLRAQQERDEYSLLVDQLRGNLQEVQSQAEADAEVYHSQLASSEELLEKERKRVQALQIDHLTRSSESANAHGEAERALAETKETLKARDAEVIKLKKQIASKSLNSSSQMELENRLRSTTDNLFQKQAQIDTLLSEKSFLQLQLENTMQNEQRNLMEYKKKERQPYSNKNDTSISIKTSGPTEEDDHEYEPKIRHRPIASLVPSNPYNPNFVSQRVVGAANFLDKMSASAGRVMRQYPLARLGVIAYIFLIHFMGFYMMASWNPEMHIDGLDDRPPPG